MTQVLLASYHSGLLEAIPAYMEAGGKWPATIRELADFAVRERSWRPSRSEMVTLCANKLRAAMRQEKHTDPQGRKVRTFHAARQPRVDNDGVERQLVLWDDIRTADEDHMEIAFQQRRTRLLNGCRHATHFASACASLAIWSARSVPISCGDMALVGRGAGPPTAS